MLSDPAISNYRQTAASHLDLDQVCVDQKAIFLQLPVAARLPVFITNLQMPWIRAQTLPLYDIAPLILNQSIAAHLFS